MKVRVLALTLLACACSGGRQPWPGFEPYVDPGPVDPVDPPVTDPTRDPSRRGVVTWPMDGMSAALGDLGVAWYYTLSATGSLSAPQGVEFVPMIWGDASATSQNLAAAAAPGNKELLGFNEPDVAQQANMTVDQALALWPLLQQTGLRLGSPATNSDPTSQGSWLSQFMQGAAAHGYKVDFLCLHYYPQDFNPDTGLANLQRFLERVHAQYPDLPIWLTEFGLVRFGSHPQFPDVAAQAAFARSAAALLDTLPYVERYAWFALPPWQNGDTLHLYDPGGQATPVGTAYRDSDLADLPSTDQDATPGAELLADPGFESGRPWETWNDLTVIQDSAAAHGGSRLARIRGTTGSTWGWAQASAARLPAGTYQAHVFARAPAGAAFARFQLHDLAGNLLATTTPILDDTWRSLDLQTTISGDGDQDALYVTFQGGTLAAGDEIRIDDFSLTRLP